METHSKVRNHECKLCYRKFKTEHSTRGHMKIVHKDEEKHFSRTIAQEELKFSCQYCSQKFLNQNILNYHFKDKHGDELEKERENRLEKPSKRKSRKVKPSKLVLQLKYEHERDDSNEIPSPTINQLPNDNGKYVCKLCHTEVDSLDNLRLHITNHRSTWLQK